MRESQHIYSTISTIGREPLSSKMISLLVIRGKITNNGCGCYAFYIVDVMEKYEQPLDACRDSICQTYARECNRDVNLPCNVICSFHICLLPFSHTFYVLRFVFKSSSTATAWAQRNKYFHILSRGVERDGWKFVLLARFSPIPSYVINYALAATEVRFVVDFLFPTVIGCLPMILQNASVGSLAGMAVASVAGKQKTQVWAYVFPVLGVLSSVLISVRIKKYSAGITQESSDTSPSTPSANSIGLASSETSNTTSGTDGSKKSE